MVSVPVQPWPFKPMLAASLIQEILALYKICHRIFSFYHISFYMKEIHGGKFDQGHGASPFQQLLGPVGFGSHELVFFEIVLL